MSRIRDFALPDLGEGLTEGEILQWRVQPGDTVALNQVIVEVETAKAAVEVPSPFAGVVMTLHHAAGETVDVGSPIITFDTDPTAGPLGPAAAGAAALPATPALTGEVGPTGRTATLVGYGPRSGPVTRRPRTGSTARGSAPGSPPPPARVSAEAVGRQAEALVGQPRTAAKPPVRKLAKELGVELSRLRGTGPAGTITRADVEHAAQDTAPVPSADLAARERRIPVKGVRKLTAEAMVTSAFTAPHVTEFVTLDMTATMELRTKVAALPEFAGTTVTPLLFVAKAMLLAVSRNPEINASWDDAAQEIVVKDYVNLGIAAATPRGLLVPNVKDADQLSLPELARALQDLTQTAKRGRTAPADLAGGTITITNVGVFGVDTGTPIINPGESAILCLGAIRPMPWVHEGQIVVRQVTQLALSFDHRNVDGQLGSQFLADVARVLSDPTTALVWG
jgi:2-oxoisovalerate dehydrogenase E2 component (dihydrolipoyl transacylase)